MSVWNTKLKDLIEPPKKKRKRPIFDDESTQPKTLWQRSFNVLPIALLVAIIFLGVMAFFNFGHSEPAHTPIRQPVAPSPPETAAKPSGYQPVYTESEVVSTAIGNVAGWMNTIVLLAVVVVNSNIKLGS